MGITLKGLTNVKTNQEQNNIKNTQYIHKNISNQYNRNEGKTEKKKIDSDNKKSVVITRNQITVIDKALENKEEVIIILKESIFNETITYLF